MTMKMNELLSAVFAGACLLAASVSAAPAESVAPAAVNPCAVPTPYPAGDWRVAYHDVIMQIDFSTWGKNVVLLGDSMMQLWDYHDQYPNGSKVIAEFSQRYPQVKLYRSLGVSGDRPEHTLWLLTEGDLLRTIRDPKVIVLMVGINAINAGSSAGEVAGGVAAIVEILRQLRPNAKILLMGIWPCWQRSAKWDEIADADARIAKLADGKNVFYAYFGDQFLAENGELNGELIRDGIHPSEAGYRRWAELMFPILDSLITTGAMPEKAN